jgi:P27 family predicted phage terminase small subunit
MTAGPPRVPTKLKLIRGTYRADRANRAEPQPKPGRPVQPENLSAGANRAWRKFSAMLDEMGVLTRADAMALECLCWAVADLEEARRALAARDGLTYMNETTAGGLTYRAYPELKLIAEDDHRLQGWLSRFGLTPSDRSKISTVPKDDPDPAGRYFR